MNGLFNNYRDNMPFIERLIKDIIYTILKIKYFFKNGLKNKTILVYPEFPNKRTTIFVENISGKKIGQKMTFLTIEK